MPQLSESRRRAVAAVGLVYGDPAQPTAQSANVDVPAGVTGMRLRALVTGHGQGNADYLT